MHLAWSMYSWIRLNFHLCGRGKSSVLLDVNCHTCSCFVHVCAISFTKGLHMRSFKICICLCLRLIVFRWHCVVDRVLRFNYRQYAFTIVSVLVIVAMWTLCVYMRERLWVFVCMREGERVCVCVCVCMREGESVVCVCLHMHPLLVGELVWLSVNCHLKHFALSLSLSLSLTHTHTHTCAHTHRHPIFHTVHVYFFVPDSLPFMN